MTATRERPAGNTGSGVEASVEEVREVARKLHDSTSLEALVDRLADAEVVLLGEASHGTSEYYRWRSRVSAQLIRDHGFFFVAVEGDWTDCYEVNRHVKGLSADESAREALSSFDRWPSWSWANWEVHDFVEWLASYNEGLDANDATGFFGLDVYGLFESMVALIAALDDIDPDTRRPPPETRTDASSRTTRTRGGTPGASASPPSRARTR